MAPSALTTYTRQAGGRKDRVAETRGNTPNGSDLRAALVRLLTNVGVSAAENAFTVKPKITDAGHVLYVVVAAPDVEAVLDSVLMSATRVDSYLPCGITVLTEAVLNRVIDASRSLESNQLRRVVDG